MPYDDVLYSLATSHPGALVLHNYPSGLRRLHKKDAIFLDVASIDVLRDRERGVPRYCAFRRHLGMRVPKSFRGAHVQSRLAARARRRLQVGRAGRPPGRHALRDAAARLRLFRHRFPHLHPDGFAALKSDRFFTTDFTPEVYTPAGFAWVQDNSLRTVLERHVPQTAAAFCQCPQRVLPVGQVRRREMGRSLRIPGLLDLLRVDARSDIRGLADDGRLDRRFELARTADQSPSGAARPQRVAHRRRAVAVGRAAPGCAACARSGGSAAPARSRRRKPLWDEETIAGLAGAVRGSARRSRARAGGATGGRAVVRRRLQGQPGELGCRRRARRRRAYPQPAARDRSSSSAGACSGRAACSPISSTAISPGFMPPASPCTISCAASNACASCGASRAGVPHPRSMPSSSSACSRRRACCARPPARAPPSPARCARARSWSSSSKLRAQRTPGRDIEFMVGNWAQCPAAAFVPALLRAVWERAVAAQGSEVVS